MLIGKGVNVWVTGVVYLLVSFWTKLIKTLSLSQTVDISFFFFKAVFVNSLIISNGMFGSYPSPPPNFPDSHSPPLSLSLCLLSPLLFSLFPHQPTESSLHWLTLLGVRPVLECQIMLIVIIIFVQPILIRWILHINNSILSLKERGCDNTGPTSPRGELFLLALGQGSFWVSHSPTHPPTPIQAFPSPAHPTGSWFCLRCKKLSPTSMAKSFEPALK